MAQCDRCEKAATGRYELPEWGEYRDGVVRDAVLELCSPCADALRAEGETLNDR